jgi:hypothetical protein
MVVTLSGHSDGEGGATGWRKGMEQMEEGEKERGGEEVGREGPITYLKQSPKSTTITNFKYRWLTTVRGLVTQQDTGGHYRECDLLVFPQCSPQFHVPPFHQIETVEIERATGRGKNRNSSVPGVPRRNSKIPKPDSKL